MVVRETRADNRFFFYYTILKIFFQYFYNDFYKKKTSRSLSFSNYRKLRKTDFAVLHCLNAN